MSILSRIKSGWHTVLHKLGYYTKAEMAAAEEKAKEATVKAVKKAVEEAAKKRKEAKAAGRKYIRDYNKWKREAEELERQGQVPEEPPATPDRWS